MNNILAAKVLKNNLATISDNSVKTATEIAIESLYNDALKDYKKLNLNIPPHVYLEISKEEFEKFFGKQETFIFYS